MKNRSKYAILALMISALLTLGSCQIKKSPSDSSETGTTESPTETTETSETDTGESSTDTQSELPKYTVRFVVEGEVVQESLVEEGSLATYEGDLPTKPKGNSELGYVFKSWDKDLFTPITQDTMFVATFSEYTSKILIDDFEQYEDSGTMIDEGWTPLGYSNATGKWTSETKAAVSLSSNSKEGHGSLRFDAWENGVGYKFAKIFKETGFNNAANALKFRLMVPSINSVRVLLHAAVSIEGKIQAPVFKHSINPVSSDYVEYVIPLDDPDWILWDNAGQSIASVADWTGVHQDTLVNYLTRIEFYVEGNDGNNGQPYAAFLDSVQFVTLTSPTYSNQETLVLNDRYTATLNSGYTLRLDVDANKNAVARVLDMETPLSVEGKVTVNGRNVEFKSNDNGQSLIYRGTLTNGGNLIKFVSADGSFKNEVDDIDLGGVQVVENFEQYSDSGIGYDQTNYDETKRSGLRGAYYAEQYTGSGSSDWAGGGWTLLPEGEEINLVKNPDQAHSGNNYATFRHKKNEAVRYMQWDLFKGTSDKYAFRGSKLGFWVKGYADKLTVSVYSQSAPTAANKDTYVRKDTFNEGNDLSEWKHLEIDLNPNIVYYGFMMLIEKDYIREAELLIDDIEVYSANPYAHFTEPEPEPEKDLSYGMSFVGKIGGLVSAKIDVLEENAARLSIPGFSFTKDGTYSTTEGVTTFTFGETTYVATIADDYSKLTFVSVNGNDAVGQYLNNLSFEALDVVENAESYKDAGLMYYQGNTDESKAKGARGAYYCDFEPGGGTSPIGGYGWTLMGGNGDQLDLDFKNAYDGKQSLKFKRSSGYDLRFMQWELYKGTAKAHKGVDKFTMYFENNTASDVTFDIYVFTVKKLDSANVKTARVEKEFTIPANTSWTRCDVALDPTITYYGYGVYTHKGSSNVYINGDYAYFSGVNNSPELNFYAKKDLVLNGNIVPGAASVTFGEDAKFSFTCANAGKDNVEGTYSMFMEGNVQKMVLDVLNTKIEGIYTVDNTGKVTFTVTNVTGDLSAYIEVNTVLTNQ